MASKIGSQRFLNFHYAKNIPSNNKAVTKGKSINKQPVGNIEIKEENDEMLTGVNNKDDKRTVLKSFCSDLGLKYQERSILPNRVKATDGANPKIAYV